MPVDVLRPLIVNIKFKSMSDPIDFRLISMHRATRARIGPLAISLCCLAASSVHNQDERILFTKRRINDDGLMASRH